MDEGERLILEALYDIKLELGSLKRIEQRLDQLVDLAEKGDDLLHQDTGLLRESDQLLQNLEPRFTQGYKVTFKPD